MARLAPRRRARDHRALGHCDCARGRLAQGRASPAGPARGARRDRRPPGDRPPPPAVRRRPDPHRLRGLERRGAHRRDRRRRRAPSSHGGADVRRGHPDLVLCRPRTRRAEAGDPPLPGRRRPAALPTACDRVRALAAGRAARPDRSALGARRAGSRCAHGHDRSLVRRRSRAEREGLPRPAGLARAEAPSSAARR